MAIYIVAFMVMFVFGAFLRSRLATALFLSCVFLFVSLRFETGFDWPVYKAIFQDFQRGFELNQLFVYQYRYSQEAGFLLVAGFFASLLPNYELFQAVVSLVFLVSIWRLSMTVGVNRLAMVFALAFSYLILTVGFSTVRQSMAIAVFNFGLIAMLSNRRLLGASLFALSVTVQMSSSIYIAAFAIARVFLYFNRAPKLGAMIALVALILTGFFVILPVVASYLPFLAERYAYYAEHFANLSGIGFWGAGFFIVFVCIAAHVSYPLQDSADSARKTMTLQSMIVVLCAFSLASEYFPIVRDRASYEMWILYSILLAKGRLRFRWEARLAAFLFGAVFTFLNVLSHPGRLAFIPYENVIGCVFLNCEGSGIDRQNQMINELDASLDR